MLQILPLGEHRAQDAAFLTGAAGLDGIQRHGGGVEPGVVVGAIHAAAECVVQQRFHVNESIPRRRQSKFDAEIVLGNEECRGGKGRRVDAGALVMQVLPINFGIVIPRPQADIAELPQADAAAHKMLVGVQNQVQQVLVGRHGEKAVDFNGIEVGEEMVQFIVGILGGIK